jgi:small subunit ribosomal protein S14
MSTTAWAAKSVKREKMVARSKEKRTALKAKLIDPNISEDERRETMFALTKMPRDSSAVRIKRRCAQTGAQHAVYRKFRLNRITFRNMALAGLLPGVTKASW